MLVDIISMLPGREDDWTEVLEPRRLTVLVTPSFLHTCTSHVHIWSAGRAVHVVMQGSPCGLCR